MKIKPRAEMKRLGIFLAFCTFVCLAGFLLMLRAFFRFRDISWERIFRTESIYHSFMIAFGAFVFLLIIMAVICGVSSWFVFKHLDKISDETTAA